MRAKSGQTLVGVLVGAAIIGILIYAALQEGRFLSLLSRSGRESNHLSSLMNTRASLLRDRIQREWGTADFLRRFATSAGSVSAFNPILDRDPNGNFTAFSGLPNPETLDYEGSRFTLSYRVALAAARFDGPTRKFVATTVTYPNSTVALGGVAIVRITVQARSDRVADVRQTKEVVIGVP